MENPYSEKFPGIGPNADGTGWAGSKDAVYANTDWYDYYFKKASIRHSHNLSITGGSDNWHIQWNSSFGHINRRTESYSTTV